MTAGRTPTVSVIVPVYNRIAYVEQTLRSALEQRFADLEVIVVDDGSTDGSYERVAALARTDARIVLRRQLNSGRPAVPRNQALGIARGKYVAFLDSDDLWLPGKLAQQVAVLDARPEVGMIYARAMGFAGERELGLQGPKHAKMPERIFETLLVQGCFTLLSTVVLRRAVLDRVGNFDEDVSLRAVEDYDLFLRVAHAYPAVFMPKVTTRYRVHDANISSDARDVVRKARRVVELNCKRFDVAPALRDRIMACAYVEEFKIGLHVCEPEGDARHSLQQALKFDPHNRIARLAQLALNAGLLRPMQLAYRNRRYATRVRDQLNRLRS